MNTCKSQQVTSKFFITKGMALYNFSLICFEHVNVFNTIF